MNTLPHPSLPPSPGSLHTHTCIPRKGPDNLMPLSHPPPRDHPYPFPTHSLSGANMQSISPAGFRGVAVLPAAAAPSFLLRPRTPRFREQEGGGGGGDSGERERERELVFWRGKSGHVGLWWEMERKGEEREEEEGGGGAGLCLQGCVMRPGRFQPPAASDTVTPPQKTNLVQDGRLFKSDRFYR